MSLDLGSPAHLPAGSRQPVNGVLGAIGDTPLVRLERYLDDTSIALWAKLEAFNPGGSAKDRTATRMLQDAIEDGLLSPGATVIESSSGNLGVGLAQACRYFGLRLICVVDLRAHETNIRTMRALGADVRIVTRGDPVRNDLLAARLELVAQLLLENPGAFWPDQYANESNPAAHAEGTMREIDEALDGDLDYLFLATSTAGTLRGCCDHLQAIGRDTRVVAVDAVGSVLFDGVRGSRRLPGFGAGVQTELSKSASFDRLLRVSDLDCVVGCRRLAEREAILAGASSGGVLRAVETVADRMPRGSRCAAILADGGGGYLETVFDDGWVHRELGCEPGALQMLVDASAEEIARVEHPIRNF
ncbi:MAG TPA: 2,3-diaminopropionate biosynthesis protein SbnA [Solirubrobacteraceae bacterium]|jgi:cysteine synthase A|nr:2,3-diaminopropionate biosynthesis protein SbnA [Solirubrobacteraceae bacterium]